MRKLVYAVAAVITLVVPAMAGEVICRPGCRAKCDATWQAAGYQNAAQCYAVWAVVNSHGRTYAQAKENANRGLGWKKAPGYNLGFKVDAGGHLTRN